MLLEVGPATSNFALVVALASCVGEEYMIECAGKDLGIVNDVCVHGNHGPYKHSQRRMQRTEQEGGGHMLWCPKQEQCAYDAVRAKEAVLGLHIAQMSVEALWSPTTPVSLGSGSVAKVNTCCSGGSLAKYLQKACWSSACW